MVSHLRTGLLVKRKDAQALAEQLQWIVEHPCERARMGFNAYDLIRKEYTSDIQASRYLSLYQSLKLHRSVAACAGTTGEMTQNG
jgi:glycosyltransferase involved in cell wall biosynthesis